MSTARTVYFPLHHQEIRLLEIAPAKWDEEIRCKLVHALLPRKPTFSALSYVWGSAKKTKSVVLDGIKHPITANAYDALRRVRQTFGAVAVWIDAICINQPDKAERSHQVQLMRQIFSTAERVVVFLGEVQEPGFRKGTFPSRPIHFPGAESNGLLNEFAARCSSSPMPTNYQFNGAIEVFCLINSMAQATKLEHVAPFNPKLKAFRNSEYECRLFEAVRQMMRCKWWNRMWTLQEVVVAKNVTILYGCCVTSWEIFAQSVETDLSGPGLILSSEYRLVMGRYAETVHILTRMRNDWARGGRKTLLSLLTNFSHREASDARDRVYALLGLAQTPLPTTPDYSMDVLFAYQSAMLGIVEASGNLEVLNANIGRKARRDIPSWVPDWTAESNILIRTRTERVNLYATSSRTSVYVSNANIESDPDSTLRYLRHRNPTASRNQQSHLALTRLRRASQYTEIIGSTDWKTFLQCKFAENIDPQQDFLYLKAIGNYLTASGRACRLRVHGNGTISLPGAELAVVTDVGQPNLSERSPESAIRSWAMMMAKLVPNARTWEMFLRTICADMVYDLNVKEYKWRRVRSDDLHTIASWLLNDPLASIDEPKTKAPLLASIRAMILDSFLGICSKGPGIATLNIRHCVSVATYRRSLFLTRDNSFGLCPMDTAIGDKIYMLLGSRTPFVLRESGFQEVLRRARLPPLNSLQWSCFKLVGDCFAYGYMDGEGMSSWYEISSAKMKMEVPFDFGQATSLCKRVSDLWDKCRTSREELIQALAAVNSQHPWSALREFAEEFLSRREFFAEYMPTEDGSGVQDSKIEVTLGDSPWMIQTDDLKEVASSTSESPPSREYLSEKRRIFNQRLAWIHDTEQQALRDIAETFKGVDETVVRNQVDVHLV